jgi:hypothetical protein
MAGKVVVSTLNNDTGVLATQNGMTGIAKAWVNFNGTGTVAINGSFNVSSITDNGTGNYTLNYTTAMPNANYSVVTASQYARVICSVGTLTTTTSVIRTYDEGGASDFDANPVCVAVFSS